MVGPDSIDGSFVPAGRETVASVEVDGEVVLLDGSSGRLRKLDPVGGVVWGCLDATGTVDEIVSDLCAEFGADRDTVRRDVIELMRTLGREGLLRGVSPPDDHQGHGHSHEHSHDDGQGQSPAPPSSPGTEPAGDEPRFLQEPPSS